MSAAPIPAAALHPAPDGAGFYGKLQGHRDLVSRQVRPDFMAVWDNWLRGGMARSQEQLGATWQSVFDNAPLWRFAMDHSVCGPMMSLGVMTPAQDQVGRRFPLTVVVHTDTLGVDVATLAAWFDRVARITAQAVTTPGLDASAFFARLHQVAQMNQQTQQMAHQLTKQLSRAGDASASSSPIGLTGAWQAGRMSSEAALLQSWLSRSTARRDVPKSLWWHKLPGMEAEISYRLCDRLPGHGHFVDLLLGETTLTA